MSEAKPIDGVIIISQCACGTTIVWAQHDERWVHQRTYSRQCPEEKS